MYKLEWGLEFVIGLLKIELFHQYYDDGVLHDASLVPDEFTARAIRRFGLQIVYNTGSLSLYQFEASRSPDLARYMQDLLGDQPLRFNLVVQPVQFFWISDLPLDWQGHIVYDSKNHVREADAVQLQPTLRHGESFLPFIARIAIYANDLIAAKSADQPFTIRMKARQTCWRYYLFNNSQQKLFDPFVTDGEGVEFENLGRISFDDGQEPILFSSGGLSFPLRQTAKKTFSLFDRPKSKSNRSESTKTLINKLPVPDIGRISFQSISGNAHPYTDMFVYL